MTAKDKTSNQLDMQISFAVYGAASRMARMHKPHLEPLGLTFPQYLVMLDLFSDSPKSVGDLGHSTGMDTGTITPLVKRLERQGMVTRRRDPDDERRVIVDLTPQAQAIREQVWGVAGKIESQCKLTEDDIKGLRDTLQNFANS